MTDTMKRMRRKMCPFGIEIKKRLIEVGMTQKEFARLIGTSEKYLVYIMYGDRSGQKYVWKICKEMRNISNQ